MTITQNTNYILLHPAFKEAINQYNLGNTTEITELLMAVQLHSIEVQIKASAKEYGSKKWLNSCDIKSALEEMRLPTTFDLRLKTPIPKPIQAECKVISIAQKLTEIKKRVVRYFNPQQLALPFPDTHMKAVC